MEVKRIDFSKNKFEANGRTYTVSGELCIDRFVEFERLQAHVGFGIDFKSIYATLKDAYDNLNKGKMADSAVLIHNLINGIATNLDNREHPSLELCALFLNREGEDTKVFDPDVMKDKIEDWRKEGYAIEDFFQLAFNFVNGFIEAYNEISQSILRAQELMGSGTGGND